MRYLLIICLILLTFGAALAQQGVAPSVSLNLSDADILDAFKTLSQQANVSILGDSTVSGKVTCSLSGLTVDQAMDVVCKMNKLQWYKTYAGTGTGETLSADKLLKIVDALGQIAGASVICTDPEKKTQTVFIPDAATVDTSALVTSLKLKEVYVVRAIPEPTSEPAKPEEKTKDKTKTKADTGSKGKTSKDDLKNPPLSDPNAAAQDAWDYVKQLPLDQQYQVVSQLRRDFNKSLSPQQKKDLQAYERQQQQQRHQQQPRQKPWKK